MTLADEVRFDFSLRNGSLSGALRSFFIAIGVFVAVPYAIFMTMSGTLSGDLLFIDTEAFVGGAREWAIDVMTYAIPLIVLSLFVGFYRAGSYAKIPFRILFALYLGSWMWIASHGGVFSMDLTDVTFMTGASSSMTFGLDVRYVVYVMIMISFAMIFLTFSEFGGNRKKYFEALEKKKDTVSKRKARRLSG